MPTEPIIDVDLNTILTIWARRPDIGALFSVNKRPDGITQWIEDNNFPTTSEKVDVITHWWTQVASGLDAPSRYGYSLRQFAQSMGQLPGQPGIIPVPTFSVSGVPGQANEEHLNKGWVWLLGIAGAVVVLARKSRRRSLVSLSTYAAEEERLLGGGGASAGRIRRR